MSTNLWLFFSLTLFLCDSFIFYIFIYLSFLLLYSIPLSILSQFILLFIGYLIIHFWEVSFLHFSIKLCKFCLLLICGSFLKYILNISSLSPFLLLLFSKLQLSFLSLNYFFWWSELINFNIVWFFFYSLVVFVSCLFSLFLLQGHGGIFLFFLKGFIVLSFTFRFAMHLELVFVYDLRLGSRYIFF